MKKMLVLLRFLDPHYLPKTTMLTFILILVRPFVRGCSQTARPGGRFAYGLEASAEELNKKDLIIKAQRRFERDTETLLR